MAGQLPTQCRRHPGFVAGRCGACEVARNPSAATSEKVMSPSHNKHFSRTSEQSKKLREQYEEDARQRRQDLLRQEAMAAMQGKAR